MPNVGVRTVIHFWVDLPGPRDLEGLWWVAGSLVLALLATNAGWQTLQVFKAWKVYGKVKVYGPALGWLLRVLFLLLPPLAAWRSGALSLYFMGLTELDWIESLSVGGPLAVVVAGLLVFGWLVYRRTLFRLARDHDGRRGNLLSTRQNSLWRALLDATLWQWHWAFYRSAAIGWLAAGMGMQLETALPSLARYLWEQPLYWGSWLGLGLVAGEWALNPFARVAWRVSGQREQVLQTAILAIITTALFVLTRNFWLCLACHLVVETAIVAWFPVAPSGIMAD